MAKKRIEAPPARPGTCPTGVLTVKIMFESEPSEIRNLRVEIGRRNQRRHESSPLVALSEPLGQRKGERDLIADEWGQH